MSEAAAANASETLDARYRAQIAYLFTQSEFHRARLIAAGFPDAASVGGLADIARLPFSEKDELRAGVAPDRPLGTHLAAPETAIVRIYSTSGTTGAPFHIPLTAADLEDWIAISGRSYAASGARAGERIVTTYNAGPFVAGVTLDAFVRLGLCHIPLGPGAADRVLAAVARLAPENVALTPSFALHLAERAEGEGFHLAGSAVRRLLVAGEPGGGEPALRARLEAAWGARVTEAMGIGDVAVSLWGECAGQAGMHFSGAWIVHAELIDPATGTPVPWEDGAEGELVYTHLRREAAPMLRFRSRDHVRVSAAPCACGRPGPRIRCVGRTDDLLIVRGVNVFPTAIRELVAEFAPLVTGVIALRPTRRGVRQDPPVPVTVETAAGEPPPDLAERIRDRLTVTAAVTLAPPGGLPRSDYKSRLVDWSTAAN